ncbi:hemin uptake protein HemP [Bartonella sp. LJL80]
MQDNCTRDVSTAGQPATTVPVIDSKSLFGGAHEVVIVHDGSTYRLKITRFGKLILNK